MGTICLPCIVIALSALSAVHCQQQQWMIRDPWGHAPIQRVPVPQATYPQQTQYQQYPQRPQYPQPQQYQPQYPPRAPFQPPPHWQPAQHAAQAAQHAAQAAQHAAQGGTNPAAAAAAAVTTAPVTTTAIPAEVEPLEVEGPTTTTTTATPLRYAPSWTQQATSYNAPPQRTWSQTPQQPQPTNAWPSRPVQQPQPNAGHYQAPPNPAVPVLVPQANVPHPTHGHYDYHPPQPANAQPQAPAQPGNANPMSSRYDVFSTQFDANAFHAARQQAKVTTPDPMQALSQALGALGLGGTGGQVGQWTNFGAPRTTPKPPTTTIDHRVGVNPYRQGGFYLAPTDFKARPKPTTQIIESRPIPDGVTFNPFDGFLGNTPPPEKKPTTALPGKNGDHFAGFLGFYEVTTPSPRADINIVNPKLSEFFAPVPIIHEQPQQQMTAGQQQQQPVIDPKQLVQALCLASPTFCPNQAPSAGKR